MSATYYTVPPTERKSDTINLWAMILVGIAFAWGVFPQPPKLVRNLFDSQSNSYADLLKWLVVFLVIWGTQGKRDIGQSLLATLLIFALYKLLEYFSNNKRFEAE